MSRADRRRAKSGPPSDAPSLLAAIAAARLPGVPTDATDRAKRILKAYVEAALRRNASFPDLVRDLKSGTPAVTVARVELAQAPDDPGYACAQGCAFCCILPCQDGCTITDSEARTLHAAAAEARGIEAAHADGPRGDVCGHGATPLR